MGTDITICVERCYKYDNGLKWVNCNRWLVNPYYLVEGETESYILDPIFDTRSYHLFALLSNVRNYDNIPSLGFDRGIPKGAAKETLRLYESCQPYAISPSWATLDELRVAKATHLTSKEKGYFKKEEAELFLKQGIPPKSMLRHEPKQGNYIYLEKESINHSLIEFVDHIEKHVKQIYYLSDTELYKSYSDKIRVIFWYED